MTNISSYKIKKPYFFNKTTTVCKYTAKRVHGNQLSSATKIKFSKKRLPPVSTKEMNTEKKNQI